VYQAYRKAMRIEQTDLAADYVIMNVWDDDHMRNIDAARWIRVAWMCRDLLRGGGEGSYPVHGFPWGHVRYNLEKETFEEKKGYCKEASDLRKLVGKDNYYDVFKDDTVTHLYTLQEGGEAPIDELEKIAEAFKMKVNLRDPERRQADALRLHQVYGMRSTEFILTNLRTWAKEHSRKIMVILSYDVPTVKKFIETGERWDEEFVDFLQANDFTYVDILQKKAEEYHQFKVSIDDYIARFYIGRAGAQVFGHYNPYGNFWFAYAIRQEIIDWIDPKPKAYRS